MRVGLEVRKLGARTTWVRYHFWDLAAAANSGQHRFGRSDCYAP